MMEGKLLVWLKRMRIIFLYLWIPLSLSLELLQLFGRFCRRNTLLVTCYVPLNCYLHLIFLPLLFTQSSLITWMGCWSITLSYTWIVLLDVASWKKLCTFFKMLLILFAMMLSLLLLGGWLQHFLTWHALMLSLLVVSLLWINILVCGLLELMRSAIGCSLRLCLVLFEMMCCRLLVHCSYVLASLWVVKLQSMQWGLYLTLRMLKLFFKLMHLMV